MFAGCRICGRVVEGTLLEIPAIPSHIDEGVAFCGGLMVCWLFGSWAKVTWTYVVLCELHGCLRQSATLQNVLLAQGHLGSSSR